jgi:hypothetical protein
MKRKVHAGRQEVGAVDGSSQFQGCQPRPGVRIPGGKREYNFFILVSVPPARGQLHKITGAQQIGTT